MKIEFESDYREFAELAFEDWKHRNLENTRLWLYFYGPALIGTVSALPVLMFGPNGLWAPILTFFITFLFCLFLYRPPAKQQFVNFYRRRYGKTGKIICEVELDDLGVTGRQFGNHYFCSWANIIEIKETDDRIFFFSNNSGHMTSIPKKALNSPAEISRCLAFAKARIPASLVK